MDTTCIYQMCSLLFIEIVQIWDMLEIVCIKITAFYYQVRLYIIVKYSYFKVPAFFFKDWFASSRISACGVADAATLMVPFSASALTRTPFAVIAPIASAAASDTVIILCFHNKFPLFSRSI